MVQIIKKKELSNIAKQGNEKISIFIPSFGNEFEKKDDVKKPKKKKRLFKKRKKNISIDKVKSNLDSKIFNNRFFMR